MWRVNQLNNQIQFEKVLEKYGKVCLEKEMALDRIAQLDAEINALKNQLADNAKSNADPPTIKKPVREP